ncbi:hypothetical protein [Marinomonas sp. CT5]|nr:hypothetical protein [Marinomonas sp. CT5]
MSVLLNAIKLTGFKAGNVYGQDSIGVFTSCEVDIAGFESWLA